MVNIIHLNTLLGIMIMMLLDPYISQTTWYINKFEENKNSITTNFYNKTGFKEVPQEKVFINNNSRFCSLCIWKVLPTNIFRRMWRCEKNVTTKNYIDMELESGFDSDSDSDYGIYIDIDDEE